MLEQKSINLPASVVKSDLAGDKKAQAARARLRAGKFATTVQLASAVLQRRLISAIQLFHSLGFSVQLSETSNMSSRGVAQPPPFPGPATRNSHRLTPAPCHASRSPVVRFDCRQEASCTVAKLASPQYDARVTRSPTRPCNYSSAPTLDLAPLPAFAWSCMLLHR